METLNQNSSIEGISRNGALPEGAPELPPEDKAVAESIGAQTAPQQLTRKQLGQMRRAYMTTVHGTVRACEHKAKFGPSKQPNNNCVDCWTAFFAAYVDLMAVHKLLTDKGVKGLEKTYGTKFMRAFHGFLGMYLKSQKAENQPTPTQETI